MILAPRRPTWQRYKKFIKCPFSLCRSMEYEIIEELMLAGSTLDVGGGNSVGYISLANVNGIVESININPACDPTYLLDVNKPFPFPDNSFDNILSANTLEHIYNDIACLKEMVRILRPGGKFYLFVPFLFAVHGSPFDYHRHTAEFWMCRLAEIGLEQIRIEPLVWSPYVSSLCLLDRFRCIRHLRRLIMLLDIYRFRKMHSTRLSGDMAKIYSNYAQAYFIHAQKNHI